MWDKSLANSACHSARRRGWLFAGDYLDLREISLRPMENVAQFVLCPLQDLLLFFRKRFACAIDVKVQHRHRRLIRSALAPFAGLSRALQRQGNPTRIRRFENLWLKVEGVALLRHSGGPAAPAISR